MCWPFTEYELEEVPQKPPPKPSPKKKRVKRKRVHWWSSLSAVSGQSRDQVSALILFPPPLLPLPILSPPTYNQNHPLSLRSLHLHHPPPPLQQTSCNVWVRATTTPGRELERVNNATTSPMLGLAPTLSHLRTAGFISINTALAAPVPLTGSPLLTHMVPMYAPRRPDFAPQPFFSPPFDMPYGYNYYPNDCVIYNNPANRQHIWYGRTEAEVREDNKILAERDGANGRHEIAPRNPRPDQSFWVRDLDGTRYVRPYQFIEDNLRPGEWRLDQRYGNLYFVRTRGDD
ncbi:uncharacterized protein BKA78DRAFT_186521 [Phyllosticta capitalensis]|uniref:uncharacterized protein n=1 Tax=Phyllosticta capitalensis TaxID=121624 RepID=UPI003130DA78